MNQLLRDFLMECFQKNPTLRISAKRLLKHPWIQSAKRTVPSVPTKPTEYTEAVKSVQEWNEALRSPNSLRRNNRLASSSEPVKTPSASATTTPAPRKPSANVTNLNIPKQRPTAESFRSPDLDANDNWDDDFAESISPNALQRPHLKPQDNFGGLFSHDRLKQYASFESVTEEPSNLDGEATVKSPLDLHRYLRESAKYFKEPETVKNSSLKAKPPTSRSTSSTSTILSEDYQYSQGAQPKTAFLRGVPQASDSPKLKIGASARPSNLFREDSVEDYSDLMPEDDRAFEKRVKAMQGSQPTSLLPNKDIVRTDSPAETFSPRLFHPSDLKSAPKSTRDMKLAANVRQRSTSSTSSRKMQRSQSEIEIQKYAEDEMDDFSDVWGDIKRPRPDSDSGSEHSSMAMVTSKMSSSFMLADEDYLDPFDQLEEGAEDIALENNVARDRDDRLAKQTEYLVSCLKTSQPEDVLLDIADQLLHVLYESPDKRQIVLRSHGLLPILEILGTMPHNDVVVRLLKIVNMLILEDAESQESLSFLGGIPIICTFAYKRYPSAIRKEAAAFVRQMYQTSTLTLQMFIGCGGINVLVEFLEEDIDTERDLVLIGVNGIWSVFGLKVEGGAMMRNDFCRIFSRSSVLYPLSLVLNRVLIEKDGLEDELAELIEGRIVNIFLIFSQAESHVKDLVADRMILKRKSTSFSHLNYQQCCDSLTMATNKLRRAERSSKDVAQPPGDHAQIHQEPFHALVYS
jgi:serine/threonine protein kinase